MFSKPNVKLKYKNSKIIYLILRNFESLRNCDSNVHVIKNCSTFACERRFLGARFSLRGFLRKKSASKDERTKAIVLVRRYNDRRNIYMISFSVDSSWISDYRLAISGLNEWCSLSHWFRNSREICRREQRISRPIRILPAFKMACVLPSFLRGNTRLSSDIERFLFLNNRPSRKYSNLYGNFSL